jgi:hypothetical protein
MNLFPFLVLWAVLAVVVLALVVYRRVVAQQEDDALHVLEPVGVAQHQVSLAQKLEHIDKWGKLLTAIAAVYGLILAVLYVYKAWVQGSNLGV